jgi:transcriptional regulator with XRE-family HTH domain
MMNINSSLVAELREKEYRDAYVGSQIRMSLPLQIRELRKRREWTQPELAERAGMGQPRISELEKPGERRLTIETLLRLASAFDVGLQVRFVPFGELIDWSEGVDIDGFDVQPFESELAETEMQAILCIPRISAVGVSNMNRAHAAAAGAGGGNFQLQGNTNSGTAVQGGQSGTDRNSIGKDTRILRDGGFNAAQGTVPTGVNQGISALLQFPKIPENA